MEKFSYSSRENSEIQTPIWSDFNQGSEFSVKLINTKIENNHTYWENMREVFAHDFNTLPLNRFKVWMSVMSVPLMSNHKHYEYIELACRAMHENDIYKNALEETFVGMTAQDFDTYYRVFSNRNITMNKIQCLGHLLYANFNADSISKMNKIVEIGAGIGDMADIIFKLGFKGEYIIYDLPELCAIQKYHHDELGYAGKIKYVSDPSELDGKNTDLTIATWSLTEMPIELRDSVRKSIDSKHWIIAYSNTIFGFDNDGWMKENFKDGRYVDIPFMQWDGGTSYYFK